MKLQFNSNLLLLFSFLIGAELVSAALIGIGLLLPVFGSSYFVCLSIFSFSVLAFGFGFIISCWISEHPHTDKILWISLFLGGIALIFIPIAAQILGSNFRSFFGALLLHESLILFPSFCLCGSSFSLVLSQIDQTRSKQYYKMGAPVLLACVGFTAFLVIDSHVLVPKFGLFFTSLLIGVLVSIVPGFLIFNKGWKNSLVLLALTISAYTAYWLQETLNSNQSHIVYSKSGILKSYRVFDSFVTNGNDTMAINRELIVNGIKQWNVQLQQQDCTSSFQKGVQNEILSNVNTNDKLLLFGINNPALIDWAARKGLAITIVEPDQTMIDIHTRFFSTDTSMHLHNSDFRGFINQADLKYDVLVINSEPSCADFSILFSVEGIERLKRLLNPGGVILFQTAGAIAGEIGKGNRSIYKTFCVMGLFVEVFKEFPGIDNKNMHYLISNSREALADYVSVNLLNQRVSEEEIDVTTASVLTDRRPLLPYLNRYSEIDHRTTNRSY